MSICMYEDRDLGMLDLSATQTYIMVCKTAPGMGYLILDQHPVLMRVPVTGGHWRT